MYFSRVLLGVFSSLILLPSIALAQATPSAYTSAVRYDELGRVTGTIAPDPDDGGSLKYAATRTTYDARGNPIKVESGELAVWQSHTVLPKDWTSFTIFSTSETTFDALNRKTTERAIGSDGVTASLVQYSYDNRGRLECTAVRMNPEEYDSLPLDACTLGAEGSQGPDRITRAVYDAAGQVLQIRKAVGTPLEIAYVTYTYTPNGKIEQVIDANGNRAELRYDGHDRQIGWVFPSKTRPTAFDDSDPATALATAGALSTDDGNAATDDIEKYDYDDNGNRTQLTKRDGSVITYQYDALNRMILKDIPDTRANLQASADHRRDVYYGYDLRGLQTFARFESATGVGITYQYDGFGRLTAETQNSDGNTRTITSQYDANGNRTRMTWADGGYIDYAYDGLNRFSSASWWHSTSGGVIPFASTTFNQRGLLEGLGLASSTTDFTYDPVGRMQSLAFDFAGTSGDSSWSYSRNPASQILSETQTNDDYTWDGHVDLTRNYVTNGLNQYDSAGSATFCYDDNGNLTGDGTSVYLYDYENRLVEKRVQGTGNTDCAALSYAGAIEAELHYDPNGRLYQIDGGTYRFLYDGNALVAEYDTAGTILRRYAHATNVEADDPLAWWEGSDMTCAGARFLHADPRGSIVALADCNGARQVVNAYDEYGIPDTATGDDIATKGRFRYTGQLWIPELGMYYYKARIYSPTLGRFLQTDPIGYEDQFNLYAYVGNDPINRFDPTGMDSCETVGPDGEGGERIPNCIGDPDGPPTPIDEANEVTNVIVVTADRIDAGDSDAAEAVRRSLRRSGEMGFAERDGEFVATPLRKICENRRTGTTQFEIPAGFADGSPFIGHTHGTNFESGLGPEDAAAALDHPSGIAIQTDRTGTRGIAKLSTGSAIAISPNGQWGAPGTPGTRAIVRDLANSGNGGPDAPRTGAAQNSAC